MEELQVKEIADRAESLRKRAIEKFLELDIQTEDIPATMQPKDGPIKLVFVGQYSAGKSSLIQMLSGIETEIGAAITTQKSSVYPWGDIEIIDTPGIETGLRKDHDEITYGEIDKAALLVFVITNEGFDNHMGEHFRKLAIEQHRGDHMILVVNKMDRAPKGNSKEQQDLLREDMKKVIQPLSHDMLYTSFVSTELYNEAMAEEDVELKEDLLQESGYRELVKNINTFVKEKGVTAKLAQPLYDLNSCIDNVGVDEDAFEKLAKQEELCKRTKRVYDTEKEDALQAIQYETMGMQSDVINIGVQVANEIIGTGISEEYATQELEKASNDATELVNACAAKVENILTSMIKHSELSLDEIEHSSLAQDVMQNNLPQVVLCGKEEDNSGNYSDITGKLSKAGNFLVEHSLKEGATGVFGAGLKSFSGTGVHQGILTVGKTLGFKFKPWQAVNMTKDIAIFGKVLGAVGVLYQIYQFSQSKEEEAKRQHEIEEARNDIKVQFQEWANTAYGEIAKQAREQVATIMDAPQKDLEDDLITIGEIREKMEAIKPTMQELQGEIYDMMDELEASKGECYDMDDISIYTDNGGN